MTSQYKINTVPEWEDKDMENVELHRANSMVKEETVTSQQINYEKTETMVSTVTYIGRKVEPIFSVIRSMKIEVLMFLYMFSYIMRSVSSTTMIMDKICLVHLNEAENVCNNLGDKHNSELKKLVEKMANNYHLGHSLIQIIPSAILSLFIGAWSDRYSRKIPIIVALSGIILDGFGTTLCAYFMKSRVEYYYISAIFTGISGGFIGVLTVLYSYASDVSNSGNRTMKYALLEMAFGLAMPLGSLSGGWIYKFFGYVPVFLTSTCVQILGLAWVVFVLEETRGLDCKESWREKFLNFWTLESFMSSFKATAKRLPNRGREQIWWLIVAMSIAMFTFASTAGIGFMYAHHQYDWDNTTFSTVSAIFAVLGIITMLIVVPLSKKFHIGDATLGIAGSISLLLKNIGIGLANKRGIYFLANLLGLFHTLVTLAGRSRISKVASKDDLGKVFAFLSTAEFILPIAAIAIVTQGFNASLDFFPGLIFVVMGSLVIIPIGIFIWLALLPKVNYEEMSNTPEGQDGTPEVKIPAINSHKKYPDTKY